MTTRSTGLPRTKPESVSGNEAAIVMIWFAGTFVITVWKPSAHSTLTSSSVVVPPTPK